MIFFHFLKLVPEFGPQEASPQLWDRGHGSRWQDRVALVG